MGILDGKGAVVTGGSRGIGRAIVLRLVADGATVVFTYRREHEAAKQVVAEAGERAVAVPVDLGEPGAVDRLFDELDGHLDGLDILVNNAAMGEPRRIEDVSDDDYDQIMTVNTKAVFQALRRAARQMRDGGRIVNLSTLNTAFAGPGIALYAASKAAVEQFTKVAARELGPRGITVNTLSPGATDTDLLRATNSEQGLQRAVAMTALGRLGQPADIADVVAMLCGPDARWITGQNIPVNGGMF